MRGAVVGPPGDRAQVGFHDCYLAHTAQIEDAVGERIDSAMLVLSARLG